jgi:hypothetical protein
MSEVKKGLNLVNIDILPSHSLMCLGVGIGLVNVSMGIFTYRIVKVD